MAEFELKCFLVLTLHPQAVMLYPERIDEYEAMYRAIQKQFFTLGFFLLPHTSCLKSLPCGILLSCTSSCLLPRKRSNATLKHSKKSCDSITPISNDHH